MDKIIYTAQVTSIGGRKGHVRSDDQALDLALGSPTDLASGKLLRKTNPEQLFAAGFAACFSSTMMAIAHNEQLEVSRSAVTVRIIMLKGSKGLFMQAEIDVSLPGITRENASRLFYQTHLECPYSKAIHGNISMKTQLI